MLYGPEKIHWRRFSNLIDMDGATKKYFDVEKFAFKNGWIKIFDSLNEPLDEYDSASIGIIQVDESCMMD